MEIKELEMLEEASSQVSCWKFISLLFVVTFYSLFTLYVLFFLVFPKRNSFVFFMLYVCSSWQMHMCIAWMCVHEWVYFAEWSHKNVIYLSPHHILWAKGITVISSRLYIQQSAVTWCERGVRLKNNITLWVTKKRRRHFMTQSKEIWKLWLNFHPIWNFFYDIIMQQQQIFPICNKKCGTQWAKGKRGNTTYRQKKIYTASTTNSQRD